VIGVIDCPPTEGAEGQRSLTEKDGSREVDRVLLVMEQR
jgi:hypothetical protein